MTKASAFWTNHLDTILGRERFDARTALRICEDLYREVDDDEVRSAATQALSGLRLALKDPHDRVRLTIARNRFIAVRNLVDRRNGGIPDAGRLARYDTRRDSSMGIFSRKGK